ncbi:hypothetical protein HPO96_27240 [Kribbella sandramycini]|uniref:Sensor c-di-GMP phosphodiesterase-like protein n=1 Tax=Kribbella sandramycini TaxID=60450 RepID=A0A7Y4L432_9ACTN|nr:hypothetical protein [Kribbella sandramycini]MBB6570818.1 sensor c-di-GMP phosphodiesterase-like protein [Kribbella sandramycini]NOL43949.1 hypothetical protein [Kribbella sandramycini]
MPPEPANPFETALSWAVWLALPLVAVAAVVIVLLVVRSQRNRRRPYPPQFPQR